MVTQKRSTKDCIIVGTTFSAIPNVRPAIIAPGILPRPPMIMTANAFIAGMEPIYGFAICPLITHKLPAAAASAEPNAKLSMSIRSTLMPIKEAASLFWLVARIALPTVVFFMKS